MTLFWQVLFIVKCYSANTLDEKILQGKKGSSGMTQGITRMEVDRSSSNRRKSLQIRETLVNSVIRTLKAKNTEDLTNINVPFKCLKNILPLQTPVWHTTRALCKAMPKS